LSINDINLLYITFSKIRLNIDNKDIGLYLSGSVSSPDFSTGTILAIFSFDGNIPFCMDMLIIVAREELIIDFESFKIKIGQEFNP
jgi:hypothetical protein